MFLFSSFQNEKKHLKFDFSQCIFTKIRAARREGKIKIKYKTL